MSRARSGVGPMNCRLVPAPLARQKGFGTAIIGHVQLGHVTRCRARQNPAREARAH